ncbi:MAG TPA: ABC transporter substrate binding protein, partial [Candidatus Binatia bacterium]|nr:ABC transporter substrate binding protein [Candidatus Binatia bacterium]
MNRRLRTLVFLIISVAVSISVLLSALSFPVWAQQAKKIPRIGLLSPSSSVDAAPWHEAFRHGLGELGWIEGNNIRIEYRYAEGKNDRIPDLATDLVQLKVDIIVATTSTETLAAKKATKTIPIVMASAADPIL